MLKYQNPNCDGAGPCKEGEVRVLPAGGDANLILCRACYTRELWWRRDRNQALAESARFARPAWETLRVYSGA